MPLAESPSPEIRWNGSESAPALLLAHGAGAPMDSPFMEAATLALVARGLRVGRFEFPYMAERRQSGRQRPPDREPQLRASWLAAIRAAGVQKLWIGGKSMGGRIATLIADEANVAGVVCLGYPFHPASQPAKLRVAHLQSIRTPTLILQGTRDPFGTKEEVDKYQLAAAVRLTWLEDGDHSYEPRKSSGRTFEQNLCEAMDSVAAFLLETRG